MSLDALLALVASTLGLPLLYVPEPPEMVSQMQQLPGQFATGAAAFLDSVDTPVIRIAVAVCVTLLLLGVPLLLARKPQAWQGVHERFVESVVPAIKL